jgi:hypothetical protein
MGIQDEQTTIAFGGASYVVQAFTLDELQKLWPSIDAFGRAPNMAERLGAASAVIGFAVGKSAEEMGAVRTNADELFAATQEIMRVAGLDDLGKRLAARKSETA